MKNNHLWIDSVLEHALPTQSATYVNGYCIRYLDYSFSNSPHQKTIVLLHGIGASAERWARVAPTLSKYFHVIVPDIVGFGYSDKPTVDYSIDFFIDFLQAFFKNLKISKPVLVGSSFGGHLATEFAIQFNRQVEKLILVSPAGIMRTSTHALDRYIMAAMYPTYENALRAFREMSYEPSIVTDATVRDFVNRMRLPNSKYAFMSTLMGIRQSENLQGRLAKIISPTLLVWGDTDRLIPMQYAKEYSEIPDRDLVVIKECGHTPFVEKPLAFNKILLKFLERNI